MEQYDYEFADECSFEDYEVADEEIEKLTDKFCVPFTREEPCLSPEELLQYDVLANQLGLARLKKLGVLLSAEDVRDRNQPQ